MNDEQAQELMTANQDVVQRWTEYLLNAYHEFLNAEESEVKYADGFMAVHNLHCIIIFEMEKDAGFDDAWKARFRRIAVDTFGERMRKGSGELGMEVD